MTKHYKIDYCPPGDGGQQIEDQGWRVYEARWHKAYRNAQQHRWTLVDVFATQEEADEYVAANSEEAP